MRRHVAQPEHEQPLDLAAPVWPDRATGQLADRTAVRGEPDHRLRPLGYAWLALFVTLALALLQAFDGSSASHVLGRRLQEIMIGASLGVAAAWLVYPVRCRAVRRPFSR
ncbi:MAG: hypothetical protein ABIQ36_11195 [Rhodanobacter sp.]